MKAFIESLDSGGGHILVALFVFLIGCALVLTGVEVGKEIIVGALASLWTVLRVRGGPQKQTAAPEQK